MPLLITFITCSNSFAMITFSPSLCGNDTTFGAIDWKKSITLSFILNGVVCPTPKR